MLIDKQEQVLEKAKKFSRSLQRLIDGRGTEMSDLSYKEKILGCPQQKLEARNKEFNCRKR